MTRHSNKSDKDSSAMPSARFEDDAPESTAVAPQASQISEEVALLTQSLKEAEEKANNHWDRLLRKEAELQNAQKRAEQDVKQTRDAAISRFATDLVQAIDGMEQGLGMSEGREGQEADLSHLLEGMKLTHNLLLSALEKQGIKVVNPALGEPFNPNFHEALTTQETAQVPPNGVVAVIQKGYMLHNRLIRPARVVVAKAPQSS